MTDINPEGQAIGKPGNDPTEQTSAESYSAWATRVATAAGTADGPGVHQVPGPFTRLPATS